MRFVSILFLIVLVSQLPQVLLLSQAGQPQAQQLEANATYRLTNNYAGPGKSLSVLGLAVVMADTSNSNDQLWKLVQLAGNKYRLINQAAGPGKSLDNRKSGDQYSAVMGDTGNYSGQIWEITPMANGKYRLTNDYAGEGKSLDNRRSGDQYSVAMGVTGDYSGQFWTLTKATLSISLTGNPISISPPTGSPTPGPTGNSTQGTLVNVPIAGDQNLVVTGGPRPTTFTPGAVTNGKLLCPIIGPGPKLLKGCTIGSDPAWASRTNGPATFRGRSTNGECGAYGRVAGLGYAFHDPRNQGECWSCPVLTHRTWHPVNSTDASSPACTAGNDEGIVWQSAQYPDPGVAAFINPEIVQLAFNDVAYVDAFLNKRVRVGANRQLLWEQMIKRPNDSPEFKALMFSAILLVAQKDPNNKTLASQAVLVFEDYIRKRRTYLAQDALGMYDAYLGFNDYKRNQGTKAAIAAGGPLFIQGFAKAVISTPQASLSATLGVPPDDYVNAAYSAAVPDNRGEEFIKALADLGVTTPYQDASSGTSSFDPTTLIQLELNKVGSATAIHDVLESYKIIKGINLLSGKSGLGIGLGMSLAGSVLDAVAGVMTVVAQEEADKQYSQLLAEAKKPVKIAQILKSGSDEERNSLIMWWALATSPHRTSDAAGKFPIQNADVCAKYPGQCADVQRVGAKIRQASQLQPVTMAPAPREFLEQVNATASLARLLATINSTATANAVKPGIADAVKRFNQAALAAKNLSGTAREAADQHKSELDAAYLQLRRELTRVRGVQGVYPILQGTLGQLDPAALRGLTLDQ